MVGMAASMCVVFVMMLGSCLTCGTLESTLVKNAIVLDGHLIVLQLTQAQVPFICCWRFISCLGILFGHAPDQVRNAARVAPLVSYWRTTFTKSESSMMPALESKVRRWGWS